MSNQADVSSYRVWAEIDIDNLLFNYRQARALAGGCAMLPVVKADAYGHGAVRVARALVKDGAAMLAVAAAQEALQLRRHGISEPVLVLGGVPAGAVPAMAGQDITVAVSSPGAARACSQALRGGSLAVHVKVDTGMSRLGLRAGEDFSRALEELEAIAALPGLTITGLFTHLAAADTQSQHEFTAGQIALFTRVCNGWEAAHGGFARHCANSAAILTGAASAMDFIRPGIMLYGYNPCDHAGLAPLRPVMTLRARVAQVKTLRPEETVGYGRTWQSAEPRVIATLSAGYADGLPRACSGKIQMTVRGLPAPQVGRICMDMCMLDVTGIPAVCAGDIVTVFGPEPFTCDHIARAAGTIPYEVLCNISARVPRVYRQGGEVTGVECNVDSL